ncbi:hypothetical protein SCHPADRAFT_896940 [Schizopora paradoxa]|uniref:JAB domain-containing protein n=1 Tax=Schizopora paradoxa TaxID=27342 RepID=A0A0H2QYB9_9AGAM|nr:hypothetical protein SCHPADRAFT_896940 [Schizopora paradoxa]
MAAKLNRAIHGKTINDVLNAPAIVEAFANGFKNAVDNDCEYGGLVYETDGVLSFKGPKKGDKGSFILETYVQDNKPKGANDNLVAVWHVHPTPDQARTCRPSDEDVDNAKINTWANVFYFVITGTKQLKGGKAFPDASRFDDVSIPGKEFKIWYVAP